MVRYYGFCFYFQCTHICTVDVVILVVFFVVDMSTIVVASEHTQGVAVVNLRGDNPI